ncbi:MAG: DNA repair protein RecO [Gemmatimonadales bacterium]
MRLIQSESLVLHAFDYRETSRIVRLATHEVGVVSVIARGARRPGSRFSTALDLFASGVAHLAMHPTRDLHTLTAFDVARARPELAESLARFGAASAVSELCLRFAKEDDTGRVHAAVTALIDAIAASSREAVAGVALGGAWRLVAELGFAPSVEHCASCHGPVPAAQPATFHHRIGGVLCGRCARGAQGGRTLPASARDTLGAWLSDLPAPAPDSSSIRAHQRLLREFLEEHLGDGRPLRAFLSWEEQRDGPLEVARA